MTESSQFIAHAFTLLFREDKHKLPSVFQVVVMQGH
jgi:hypothetical protein